MARINQNVLLLAALTATGMLSACANYEVNTKRGDIPGYSIRRELQEADRAVEAARLAGKDKACPAEFKAAEAAKNNAYDVFRACHTEEGIALAKQATAKVGALCPPQMQKAEPLSAPVVTPPVVVPVEPAAAPEVIPAPTSKLTIVPGSIAKGQTTQLSWTSENATVCDIQPAVGQVKPQGAMTITPADNMAYNLVCKGKGGTAESTASVVVIPPAPPVVATSQPKAAAVVNLCAPTTINVQFDTNKSDLKPQYHEELKKLADFLTEFPKANGVIEGHTDSVGDKASNMKLSQRRADSIRNYLIKTFGIAPDRIAAKGYGPTKPIADNKTKEGKQKNRRIDANFKCND
jgi:OOP family OmpA-OmpF porin